MTGQAQTMGALTNVHNLVLHVLARENHLDLLLRAQRAVVVGVKTSDESCCEAQSLAVRGWGRCTQH
jgi:hypothetical protein